MLKIFRDKAGWTSERKVLADKCEAAIKELHPKMPRSERRKMASRLSEFADIANEFLDTSVNGIVGTSVTSRGFTAEQTKEMMESYDKHVPSHLRVYLSLCKMRNWPESITDALHRKFVFREATAKEGQRYA